MKALNLAVGTLAVTSQLLAIGIELGILAGGYYIFKKFVMEPDGEGTAAAPVKAKWKDRIQKAKRIVKAVTE